jgi:hypothetical protein
MPATVEVATGTERQPDAETPAEKSAVTLNYEEMLAALNGPAGRDARRETASGGIGPPR